MMQRTYILTYGLTDEQNALVAENLPTKRYSLWIGDDSTDLIAVPCTAMIVQASSLTDEEEATVTSFYDELGPLMETVFWLGETDLPPALKRQFKCYPSFSDIADKLKYLLLDAHKRTLETVEFSNRIAMILRILREIKIHPGISTNALADKLDLSSRTVQRHIETLRMAGEFIDYDRSKRGWKLFENKSELMGDW